jgi:hypothetical protein
LNVKEGGTCELPPRLPKRVKINNNMTPKEINQTQGQSKFHFCNGHLKAA